MGRVFLTMLAVIWVMVGCSTTPTEHSKAAYRKYSLECVARGIPEHTQAHTDCVVNTYATAAKARKRSETMMQELIIDSKK